MQAQRFTAGGGLEPFVVTRETILVGPRTQIENGANSSGRPWHES